VNGVWAVVLGAFLFSIPILHAESQFQPYVSGPGPTLIPGIEPSPAFRVYYDPPTVPTPPPAVQPPAPVPMPTSIQVRPDKPAPLLPPITLSIFGGGDFISFNEVNALVGTNLFDSTAYFGGEFRYPVSSRFSLLLRAEKMWAGSSVGAAAFSLGSLPIMAGLDFHSPHQRKFRFHVSVLAGPALNTNLTETASSLPTPNVTQFSSAPMSEMLRLSLEYPLTRTVGIFGEAGYRFLKTSSLMPSPVGSGGTVFQSNGQYQAVPLNLSGPFVGGGFVFVL
jgi:hypothetical protein